MDRILKGISGVFCLVYLDDIIIYSRTLEEHKRHIKEVIERLRKNNLKVKLDKCKFAQRRIEYLSHIIEDGTIRPNPEKVVAVEKFPVPTSVKTVQSFLGLVSYYRKFIKGCAHISSPLIHLTHKEVPFDWTPECKDAFERLKTILLSEGNVLILPNFEKPFRVECDASKFGVGGVLSQETEDGRWRPVSYFSKHLNKTESGYSASEREMLAIVLSVERFKQYLYGRSFTVLTDHQPLKYMLTAEVPQLRLARMVNRLSSFVYDIVYRAGAENGAADGLSRSFGECCGNDPDSIEEGEMINAVLSFSTGALNEAQLEDPDLRWIYDLKKKHKFVVNRPPSIKAVDNKERVSLLSQWNRLVILGSNLYREYVDQNDRVHYQFIVPKSERKDVLKRNHDEIFSGHLGVEKTTERIVRKFYWYRQLNDIVEYVRSCDICQQTKIPVHYNTASLQPLLPTRPFELVTTDIMGPITKTKSGNLYVLVAIDHFTKWVELFPLSEISAKTVANRLMSMFLRHGIPETLLSDQGTNYQSELMAEFCELLDIHKVRTSPYHPQCDGITERFNRSLQAMLTSYVNEKQDNWDELLPNLAFAYNTAVHSATKMFPFQLLYGRIPKVPSDLIFEQDEFNLYLNPKNYAESLYEKTF